MKLKGQVAIVTGAGRNIGEEIAKLFAAEGAKVAVVEMDKPARQTRGGRHRKPAAMRSFHRRRVAGQRCRSVGASRSGALRSHRYPGQ